jgi:uncharacterized protein (DUF362 family)
MADDSPDDLKLSRRRFIQSASAIAAGAGTGALMTNGCTRLPDNKLKAPTAAQKAGRRTTDSSVVIAACKSYEQDIFALLKPQLKNADLPDLHGKVVVIKPNMLDCVPGKPIATDPAVIQAAVELANHLGAKQIIAAEGTAHNRDTQYLLENSGHGALYRKLGLRFVDLNEDDIEKVENPNPFTKLAHIYFPKTVLEADAIISVPKLKTHHWARMTCSMKNMFGCIPGRKYGYPKNVLHFEGIDNCILDINRILRPPIQLVDAVIAMEGDGPIMGNAKPANLVLLGNDAAATDATGARIMGINIQNIPYLRYAGEIIGNTDEQHIKILGLPLSEAHTPFKPAPTFDATGRSIKFEDPNQATS